MNTQQEPSAPARILIVEDERIVAEDLREALLELGYDVIGIAATAAKALSMALEGKPDVVCMDIVIKGDRDGIDVAGELWREHMIPSVFTTAYSDEAIMERAANAHPAGFLVKPYDIGNLRCTLEVALAKIAADKELHEYRKELELKVQRTTGDLENTREQLIESQKMEAVGTLTGGIAHDFNNMLLPITGYAQILAEELDQSEPKLAGYAKEIFRAASSAASLTRQLLAFSRRQILEKQVRDVHELIRGCQKMLSRVIGEDLSLCLDLDEKPASCLVDSGQIEQVLMNLCINARDAMEVGGMITVTSKRVRVADVPEHALAEDLDAEWLCLEVRDTGRGMSPSTASRVFEPFFSTKGNMGTGLGLSVVHGIVTQHDGEIEVESTPGTGTIFRIFIPLADSASHSSTPPESDPAQVSKSNGGSERILVIEDEAQVRLFVSRALANKGYEVETAYDLASAKQVLDRTDDKRFDLIFSDCVLPDGNGVEFLNEELPDCPDTRAILTTGYTDREALLSTAEEHDIAFLQKPYPLPRLFETVREVLES